MSEQWHPLGPVGVITAFNFPVAVWAWNAFLAAIAGDTVIWKPSPKARCARLRSSTFVTRSWSNRDTRGSFPCSSPISIAGRDDGPRSPFTVDLVHRVRPRRPPCGRAGGQRLGRTRSS